MKKSEITDIDRQIYRLAVECEKTALPIAKGRIRNGCGLPLSAWMDAITVGSKILGVLDEDRRKSPSKPMGIHIERIVDRILAKKQLTEAQADCLIEFIAPRYRGHPDYIRDWHPYPKNVLPCTGFRSFDLYAIKATPKAPRMPITLKFILSEQLTDLILLRQLFSTIQDVKNAPIKPNHNRRQSPHHR